MNVLRLEDWNATASHFLSKSTTASQRVCVCVRACARARAHIRVGPMFDGAE